MSGKNQPLQSEGTTGDMGKVNSVGISSVDKTHSQIFVAKDDDTAAAAASRTALPSPPPNTSALQAAQHLCYDEDGNAFYFNDLTGKSVWAEVWAGGNNNVGTARAESNQLRQLPSTPQRQQQQQLQVPEGWSFHHDPDTGHAYYLQDASCTSVWAAPDGSFPGVGDDATAGKGLNGEGRRTADGGHNDLCASDADACFSFSSTGERPFATAPPPPVPPLEPAEEESQHEADAEGVLSEQVSARGREGKGGGWGESDGAGDGGDKSMPLCTQELVSTNALFEAQQLDTIPSCSGGSPMASAPPAAESGGGRSSCSPLPTTGAVDDNKWGFATPTAAADDGGSVVDHDGESNGGGGGGDSGIQDIRSDFSDGWDVDGAESIAGDNNRRQNPFAAPSGTSQQLSYRCHYHHRQHRGDGTMPEGIVEGAEEASLRTAEPQAAGIRVCVWDTATAASGSQNPLVAATAASNRFNTYLPSNSSDNDATLDSAAEQQRQPQEHLPAGNENFTAKIISSTSLSGNSEAVSPGADPGKPYTYENLFEKPKTWFPAASSTATARSCYPKVVDRNGLPGSDLSGRPAGGDTNGRNNGVGSVNTTSDTMVGPEEADGSLATAAERGLSIGGNNAQRAAPDGSYGRKMGR